MKDLLFAVMVVSLTSAAVTMLAPEGKGIGKQIRFLCAVVVCASLVAPMLRLLGGELKEFSLSLPDVSAPTAEEAQAAILRLGTEGVCRELEAQVAARFAIREPRITLVTDASDLSAVTIVSGCLSGSGELEEAGDYLSELLGCEFVIEEG